MDTLQLDANKIVVAVFRRNDKPHFALSDGVDDVAFVDVPEDPAWDIGMDYSKASTKGTPPLPPTLSKAVILQRLVDANLAQKAFDAAGGAGGFLYASWLNAPASVRADNPLLNQVLDAIGADKSVILAPETK